MPGILEWTLFGSYTGSNAVTVLGVVVCVACMLGIAYSFAGGGAGQSARWPAIDALTGAVSGLALGLGVGLAAGLLFEFAQWRAQTVVGFMLPGGMAPGIAIGVGLGVLLGFATMRLPRLPLGPVAGLVVGLAFGLIVYRLAFGPSAGFGRETDQGVGPEIGLLLGAVGALAGAFAGALVQRRLRRRPAHRQDVPAATDGSGDASQRWIPLGMLAGCAVGVLLAGLGGLLGVVQLILPRVAGMPDVYRPATFMDGVLGVLYGLATFGIAGALIGGLVAAIARLSRRQGVPVAQSVSLAVGLVVGVVSGLSAGLAHLDVGGPLISTHPLLPPTPVDPAATGYGLLLGLGSGLLVGALCAALLWWAEKRPDRRKAVACAAVLALGVAVLLFPHWFHPIFGVNIY